MRVALPVLSVLLLSACASVDARVRTAAAHDLSCKKADTRIVDSEASVYRVAGCGEVATYKCQELPSLTMQCDRVHHPDPALREVTTATGKYSLSRPRD